jgi:YegS/Rv2252/BmrU family lipid kinase
LLATAITVSVCPGQFPPRFPACQDFLLDSRRENKIIGGVRICVIFNPVARGDQARHFRDWLNGVSSECALKPTQRAGDARRLAAEAVAENFETIVAAGGDGTVNEVLNGIGDAPGGFEKTRLGVLPLGTVNVFARELKIPMDIAAAWEIVRRGNEMKIDLPCAEFFADGKPARLFLAQLAGAGLDTRAIELVNWELKKKIGPLAYVVAGLKALAERKPQIAVRAGAETISGELVLLGNGKLYGGDFQIFPAAELRDGKLDACVFPRVNFWTLLRVAPGLLWRKRISEKFVRRLAAEKITLTGEGAAAFELDGEWAGKLPVTFSVAREKLRVVVP